MLADIVVSIHISLYLYVRYMRDSCMGQACHMAVHPTNHYACGCFGYSL